MSWYPTANEGYQTSHFALGGFGTLAGAVHGHVWIGVLCVILFAAGKEFWFDFTVEHDTAKGSATDFLFYAVGIAAGLAVYFL